MGKGYSFNGATKGSAVRKAIRFVKAVNQAHNRRCSIVGANQTNSGWRAVVDVCGNQNMHIDALAAKINKG